MTVTQDDLTFLQSALPGSTGGAISGIEDVSGVMNNMFADISPAQATAGGTQTRKWFIRNDHVSDDLDDFGVWIEDTPDECTEEIAVGFDSDDDDSATVGDLDAWTGDAVVAVVSDGADTRQVTVVGVNAIGEPMEETVTLNGVTEVLTTVTFSEVYAVRVASESSRVVTIKQGSGGTTMGTIPAAAICTFLWIDAPDLASSIKRMAIGPGDIVGFWDRITWTAGASEVDPNQSIVGVQRLA